MYYQRLQIIKMFWAMKILAAQPALLSCPKVRAIQPEKCHLTSLMFSKHHHPIWRLSFNKHPPLDCWEMAAGETAQHLLSTQQDLRRDKVSCYITFRETCATREVRKSHFWRHQPCLPLSERKGHRWHLWIFVPLHIAPFIFFLNLISILHIWLKATESEI